MKNVEFHIKTFTKYLFLNSTKYFDEYTKPNRDNREITSEHK